MAKSIIQEKKECYICGQTQNLHMHHCYFGAKRKISETNGFKVWLCGYHHNQSNEGVHGKDGHKLDLFLKRICQREYEKKHNREDFINLIGKNYLD